MVVVDLLTKDVHDIGATRSRAPSGAAAGARTEPSWIGAAPKWRTASGTPRRAGTARRLDEQLDTNAVQRAEEDMAVRRVDTPSGTEDGAEASIKAIACVPPAIRLTAMPSCPIDVPRPWQPSAQFVAAESHATALTSRTLVEAERPASTAARSEFAAANRLSMDGGGE
jgi:hypothetical protein